MTAILYPFLSGDSFFVGLVLLAAAASAGRAWPRTARASALAGLVLTLASAVPAHPIYYGALSVAAAVWLWRPARLHSAFLIGAAVLGVALELPWHRNPSVRAETARPVAVLGDSLSARQGSSLAPWTEVLAQGARREVLNLAWPGATLASGASQAGRIPSSASLVIVELGGNDLLSGARREPFAADLGRLLRAVVAPGREVLMFELPLLPLQNRYGRIQRQAAGEFGVRLIARRVLAGAVTLPGNTSDGLHLSPTGHLWLADRVARWL